MRVSSILFGVTAVLTACCTLSPAEAVLVGTWEQLTIEGPIRTTLETDHTWASVGGMLEGSIHGRWRVEGDQLVLDFDWPRAPEFEGRPKRFIQSVREFTRIYHRLDELPKKASNRVAGRIGLPAPTPPDMRVRIRRFRSD